MDIYGYVHRAEMISEYVVYVMIQESPNFLPSALFDLQGNLLILGASGGNLVIPFRDGRVRLNRFYEGLVAVSNWTDGDWAAGYWNLVSVIDTQGNEVIPPQFNEVSPFAHGRAVVRYRLPPYEEGGPYRFPTALINRAGEYIVPPGIFNQMAICYSGVVLVSQHESYYHFLGWTFERENARFGLIDLDGNEIVPLIYSYIPSFRQIPFTQGDDVNTQFAPVFWEGRAIVKCTDGLWGFINIAGEEVIPPQFAYASPFINGIALVNEGATDFVDRYIAHEWVGRQRWQPWLQSRGVKGGTWHLIDLYDYILKSFDHVYMERISDNLLIFKNDYDECWQSENFGILVIERDEQDI